MIFTANPHLPFELLYYIYKLSDPPTRILLNKALGWNFRIANPFLDYGLTVPFVKGIFVFVGIDSLILHYILTNNINTH